MIVYVDDREPIKIQKLCKHHLSEFGTVEVAHLPVGDIVFNDIVIERKTIPDFVSSQNEGRLPHQVDNMLQNFDKCWIVTVGNTNILWGDRYASFRPKRFKSHLIEYQDLGVKTIETANDSEFIGAIASILKRAGDQPCDLSTIHKRARRTGDRNVGIIMAAVDGIGPKTAVEILKNFKVWELYEVSEKDIHHSVKGVGPVLAKKIKEVFRK